MTEPTSVGGTVEAGGLGWFQDGLLRAAAAYEDARGPFPTPA